MPVPAHKSGFVWIFLHCETKKLNGGVLLDPPACAHRFGQYHSSSVNSLKDALQVDPSGDLSDQNRSNSFGTKLLVDAEEIDLNHFLFSKNRRKTLM